MFRFLIVLFAVLYSAVPAFACDCVETSVEQAIDQAAHIFEGRVIAFDEESEHVRFRVTQTWRGSEDEEITIHNPSICGVPFEQDEIYLVYALEGEVPLVLLCNGTRPIEEATEDLEMLGPGVTPVDPETAATRPPMPTPPAMSGGCASCAIQGNGGTPSGLALLALVGLIRRKQRVGRRVQKSRN